MVFNKKYRELTINVISLLFILLFAYAASSKLLDYNTFTVQIAQSPLLTAFAGFLGWMVPFLEIVIAVLLFFPRTRLAAMYVSFFLMILFTAYIFIILNFSDFVPCACGGVLEEMSWSQHLIFNLAFVLLAGMAIFLMEPATSKKIFFSLSLLGITAVGSLILLFYVSDSLIQRNNSFIRKYPHSVAVFDKATHLEFNSWYLAGAEQNRIYLGNVTAPLNIMILDTSLTKLGEVRIALEEMDLPFSAVKVQVSPPHFYVSDGAVPAIFKGDINDWKASLILKESIFFSIIRPIDSTKVAIRYVNGKSKINEIGLLDFSGSFKFYHSQELLQKQTDGIFDTDGQLLYNQNLKKLLYVYFYRNEYVVFDSGLVLDYKGKTIDTISQANLKVSVSEHASSLASPSFSVNSFSETSGNYLYIKSERLGKHEPKNMLNKASIIDVYDIRESTYKYSFYIHNYDNSKLTSFMVLNNKLIALMGKHLVLYDLIKQ
jgi:uncharacterized membrane protein YphA (DoxX/SURF4 family)